jgi:hypothetical protein
MIGNSDLADYRAGEKEQERIGQLFSLVALRGHSALDIGARDGYLAMRLVERFDSVTALDLKKPRIDHPLVTCVQGNAISMPFPDRAFDLVLCAEVLEHVPAADLSDVAVEIARVTGKQLLIGVPNRQDTRLGRTTCRACGAKNPPWGHVNEFDEAGLRSLFPDFTAEKIAFVGTREGRTNALSTWLMDFAGNPYGVYDQEEPCIGCGATLLAPSQRSLRQKLATRAAHFLNSLQAPFVPKAGNWIHILFSRP